MKVVFIKLFGDEENINLSYLGTGSSRTDVGEKLFKEEDMIEIGGDGVNWYMNIVIDDIVTEYILDKFTQANVNDLIKQYKKRIAQKNWSVFGFPERGNNFLSKQSKH